jgi:glycosyltransferase involved in cell wall biosynthesis
MLAAYMARVPIRMHSFTGLVFPTQKGLFQLLLIKMDQLLCRMATHVYPEGQGVKNDLLSFDITKKPLKVLANGNINGIDTQYYSPDSINEDQKQTLREQLGIAANDLVFCFVGRLVKDKGINELVSSFSEICKNKSSQNIKLLLVGNYEQDLDALLKNTIQTIEENPNIIACGWQQDVRPFMAISQVFVLPSYREGFPNVLLQAGAMGLPSIVTNINGCNEIIQEGVNGCIIPPKNIPALSRAMQQMLENPVLRQALGKNARPSIASRFEQELVWEALLEEYKNLLREKNIETFV